MRVGTLSALGRSAVAVFWCFLSLRRPTRVRCVNFDHMRFRLRCQQNEEERKHENMEQQRYRTKKHMRMKLGAACGGNVDGNAYCDSDHKQKQKSVILRPWHYFTVPVAEVQLPIFNYVSVASSGMVLGAHDFWVVQQSELYIFMTVS